MGVRVCVCDKWNARTKKKQTGRQTLRLRHYLCKYFAGDDEREEGGRMEAGNGGQPEVASIQCLNEILFQYLKGPWRGLEAGAATEPLSS